MLHGRWLHGILPGNLRDDTFGSSSYELPKPLPPSKTTEISYLIAKTRLAEGLATALHEVEQPHTIPYSRVIELDRSTYQIYHSIPNEYHIHELPEQPIHNPLSLATGLVLANIFHKTLCIIHSKYLKAAVTNPRYRYSRQSCVESAVTLLKFQAFQHQQFRIEGRITTLTKYQTSITIHDYFLAATMLCSILFLESAHEFSTPTTSAEMTKEEILAVLERSVGIFSETRNDSVEARRACELFEVLLIEIRRPRVSNERARHNDPLRDSSEAQSDSPATIALMNSSPQPPTPRLTQGYSLDPLQPFFSSGGLDAENSMLEEEVSP